MYVFDNSTLDSLVMADRWDGKAPPTEVEVPLATLDSIVAELGLERIDYIKMDIEGAERHALQGARETLQQHRPTLSIATENLPDDIRIVPQTIQSIVPDYRYEAGGCRSISASQMRPEALHFQAKAK